MRQGPQNTGCYYTIDNAVNDEKVTYKKIRGLHDD